MDSYVPPDLDLCTLLCLSGLCGSLMILKLTFLLHARDYWSVSSLGRLPDASLSLLFFLLSFVPLPEARRLFDLCLLVQTADTRFMWRCFCFSFRWYSCMLGKKCSLAPLKEELRKQGVSVHRGVKADAFRRFSSFFSVCPQKSLHWSGLSNMLGSQTSLEWAIFRYQCMTESHGSVANMH